MANVGEELTFQAIEFKKFLVGDFQLLSSTALRYPRLKLRSLQTFVERHGEEQGDTGPEEKE